MVDFYEYSTPELVRLLGNRFKEWYSWQHFIVNIYCVVESGRTD